MQHHCTVLKLWYLWAAATEPTPWVAPLGSLSTTPLEYVGPTEPRSENPRTSGQRFIRFRLSALLNLGITNQSRMIQQPHVSCKYLEDGNNALRTARAPSIINKQQSSLRGIALLATTSYLCQAAGISDDRHPAWQVTRWLLFLWLNPGSSPLFLWGRRVAS